MSEIDERIKVYARCRPLNYEEQFRFDSSIVEIASENNQISVGHRNCNREFLFDKVFGPNSSQADVYDVVLAPLVQDVMDGYNCTVFVYGHNGTGKSYTMQGERSSSETSWEDDPHAGLIARCLFQLFEKLTKEGKIHFSMHVSFLNILNKEVVDLLGTCGCCRCELIVDSEGKNTVVIHGLEDLVLNSKEDIPVILDKAFMRRQTAATLLYGASNCSNTLFTVTLQIKEITLNGDELLKTGKILFVDLEASENVAYSEMVKAGSDNQSLLTMKHVFTSLMEAAPHVPYLSSSTNATLPSDSAQIDSTGFDTMLSSILKVSLECRIKIAIIATISPSEMNYDKTICTLDYATKAKNITINYERTEAHCSKKQLDLDVGINKTKVFIETSWSEMLKDQNAGHLPPIQVLVLDTCVYVHHLHELEALQHELLTSYKILLVPYQVFTELKYLGNEKSTKPCKEMANKALVWMKRLKIVGEGRIVLQSKEDCKLKLLKSGNESGDDSILATVDTLFKLVPFQIIFVTCDSIFLLKSTLHDITCASGRSFLKHLKEPNMPLELPSSCSHQCAKKQ